MRTRTGFDTDERKSRFFIVIEHEQSHSSFDCLQWREIDLRSLDLDLSM